VKAKGADQGGGSVSECLPLVFGVSGHRDLLAAAVPQLRKELSKLFARFREAYPHTPFRLLTPLAEGADRLAAEVALASRVGLFVPLPMKQREYEKDFTTAESLAEFRAFLAQSESHWEIPTAKGPGINNRNRHYAEVGDFIARHSHVFILLWDGSDNRKVGGTAWVKKRREYWVNEGCHRCRSEPFGYGPTIQIVTPRTSGRPPRPRPATIGELPASAGKFAAALAKCRDQEDRGRRQKRPPLYQLVYWEISRFNASVPRARVVKKRKKGQSATRSRL
jgi:hypothetical protein